MNCCSKGVDEMADIIKVEHLSYVYNPGLPTAVTALDDVSFTVEEGDLWASSERPAPAKAPSSPT